MPCTVPTGEVMRYTACADSTVRPSFWLVSVPTAPAVTTPNSSNVPG